MAKTSTSFKPGQVANPNGRPPKGYSITEMVKQMLQEKPEIRQAIATKIFEKALQGDPAAYKLVWQYMDGMPQQKVDLTVTKVDEILDELETNYDELGQEAKEQVVAPEPPVQNQE
jgi:hypothetical protein